MASAVSASLRVRPAARRNQPSNGCWTAVKALLVLAAVAIAALGAAAFAVGVGGWLTVSFAARPDTQLAIALPTDRLARYTPRNIGAAAQRAIVAGLSLPEPRSLPQVSEPATVFALAAPTTAETPKEPDADPDDTGSLGNSASAPTLAEDRRADTVKLASSHDDTPLLPLPRPRPKPQPRLAALTLKKDFSREGEEDARAPRTAIYDISAKTVYLPSGERLEAHSGLGDMMDDPRHVHRRMRGATPPNTYKLTLRESLFHGVQAIRMTPLNDGKMFGRAGILAHSYMLGPNGQSNGCVSFRDYPRFLQAFMRGEVNRMVVVSALDRPPTAVARREVRSAENTF
jgi:hypothetical protein